MSNLLIIANVAAMLAAAFALLEIFRLKSRDRFALALGAILVLFFLLSGIAIAMASSQEIISRPHLLQLSGYLLLIMLVICAWLTQSLFIKIANWRWTMAAVIVAVAALCLVNFKSGLFLLDEEMKIFSVLIRAGGKYLLGLMILSSLLALARYELAANSLASRFGRRSSTISFVLLLLLLSVIAFGSVSLVYGKINTTFLMVCQVLFALLFVAFGRTLRYGVAAPSVDDAVRIRITGFLSSGTLIYGGIYLIAVGLMVKVAMVLGGDWRQFVSFCAALGAIIFALAIITGTSLRNRWTRFVERNLLAGTYDFRRELQHLTEAISTAKDKDKLLQVICEHLRDIFAAEHCCLLLLDDAEIADQHRCFQVIIANENRKVESYSESVKPSRMELEWLHRMNRCFAVQNFILLGDEPAAEADLKDFVRTRECKLGVALSGGQSLLGALFLGGKLNHQTYSEEDKQLIEVLANAISISLHGTHLQQLIIASKQMESIYRVTSFVMHDLRNVAATLNLLAQNAKNHLDKKNFRSDTLAALARIAKEMQRLIDRLSMVKTGHELQDYELCNPSALAFEVLDDLQLPANIGLSVEIPSLSNAIWVKDHIRTVLRNLLLNAIEAMPTGGKLSVRAEANDSQIQFSISDTGKGMTEDFIRRRLFKPHQTTKSKGLGIGLYQSKELISAHGGRIQVTSQPNQGATFDVILPLRSGNPAADETVSLATQESAPAEKMNVASWFKMQALVNV